MQQFPASFPLKGRRVVVIGGGEAARLKVRLFAASPADIETYASEFNDDFAAEFSDRAKLIARSVEPADFKGAALAVVALDNDAEARAAADLARAAGVPVNVVDRPDLSDWQTPSIVNRGEVVIAIATGGAAPVIARDLRAKIERVVPRGIGVLASAARALRHRVREALPHADARRTFWERALRGPAAARADANDVEGAHAALESDLENRDEPAGVVFIVGAGPGDPDLLTL
ncbi:MAG: siroheme synthase, partial [Maricaulaceae bacterium]